MSFSANIVPKLFKLDFDMLLLLHATSCGKSRIDNTAQQGVKYNPENEDVSMKSDIQAEIELDEIEKELLMLDRIKKTWLTRDYHDEVPALSPSCIFELEKLLNKEAESLKQSSI